MSPFLVPSSPVKTSLYHLLNCIICESSSQHTLSSMREGLCSFPSASQWFLTVLRVDTEIFKMACKALGNPYDVLSLGFCRGWSSLWNGLLHSAPPLAFPQTLTCTSLLLVHFNSSIYFTLNSISSKKASVTLKLG